MDHDKTEPAASWIEELAKADADVAQGRLVPSTVVREELASAIAALDADIAGHRPRSPAAARRR